MKNYEKYTILDFVKDDSFRDWVRGIEQQEGFWVHFLEQFPHKNNDIRQAELLVRAMDVAPEYLSEKEIRSEVNQFLENVHLNTKKNADLSRTKLRWWQRPSSQIAAAVAALLLVYGGWSGVKILDKRSVVEEKVTQQEVLLAETVNDTNKPLQITLEDGSLVTLSPYSRLRYAPKFSGNVREVFLVGEASFEVVKKIQPFLVQTGNVTTKVLGTSFVVSAYEKDHRVTVQVRSGKVSVFTNTSIKKASGATSKGLILIANQAAVFEEVEKQLSKTLVGHPILLRPEVITNHFSYDETPLSIVLRQLEQAYSIHFQFDDEILKNCKITAVLSNESLYEKLNLLCKITGTTYEIVDGQIVIDAHGCQ
ncbi:MAG: FecR family protein [Spirosomataceae bacterium]